MGIIGAYLTTERKDESYQDKSERILHFNEFTIPLKKEELEKQASRCMDCGVPFCHSGCPLGNVIPDFNDAIANEDWKKAAQYLFATNSFPEFTGRVCPAPCESSCVLSINQPAVSIKQIEKRIVESAYENGWVKTTEVTPTGYKVAVIGAGPAGLAAADKLAASGHDVTVYEKDKYVGGLLRYGIPDFKLEKSVIERRIEVMEEAGVEFITSTEVGKDIRLHDLDNSYDAVLFTIGAQEPRDLAVEGRELNGVHFAMEYLRQSNQVNSGESKKLSIDAKGKKVLVIGGGDTGSDCLGTAIRQGAEKVTQIDIIPEPLMERSRENPWPEYPITLKTSTSQKEGGDRKWNLQTTKFIGNDKLEAVEMQEVKWLTTDGKKTFETVENSTIIEEYDLVFLALGFLSPTIEGIVQDSNLELTERNNIKADQKDYKTSRKKFFAAGDARRGQSLVVWAISEGRDAATSIDKFLTDKQ
ncbi:MAG: glutamate synthase subunit beta [Bacteroidota bacterium]